MDEYLSKPLKPNHLIQTILKCATLGGALLEKERDLRSPGAEEPPSSSPPSATAAASATISNGVLARVTGRPDLDPRALGGSNKTHRGSLESSTTDGDEPLARVSKRTRLS